MNEMPDEDDPLEARLRAFSPADPPEGLRRAVLGGRTDARMTLPGWLTIAALLLLTFAFRSGARSDAARRADDAGATAAFTSADVDADALSATAARAIERRTRAEARRAFAMSPPPGVNP